MHNKTWERWFMLATALTMVSAVTYCTWPLGFWLNPAASKAGLASELGAAKQPYNWLFIGGDIVSGCCLLLASCILLYLFKAHAWAKACLLTLAVYGVCGAIDAALPLHCLPSETSCGDVLKSPQMVIHGGVDIIGSAALVATLIAAWRFVRAHNRKWRWWIYVIGGGGVVFGALSAVFLLLHGPGYWAQRYYLTLSCMWVASIPFVLRTRRYTI